MPIFLSSCSYFLQGRLEIVVTAGETPVSDAQLTLYGKNKNKEIFIGYLFPNSQGFISTDIDFSKYQSIKVVTTNKSIEKILLPSIEHVSIPGWWQEQVVKLNINLTDPSLPMQNHSPLAKQENKIQDEAKPELPEIVLIPQIESNLYEPPPTKPQLENRISATTPLVSSTTPYQTKPLNKTITEKKVGYWKSTTLKITSEGKPLNNVNLYIGYNVSQTIKREGSSNEAGEIKFDFYKPSPPDVLIIKKNGFITNVTQFMESSSQSIIVDLKPGKSMDFLVQNYAYGVGRGMDKTELYLNGVKQDVSTPIGFLTYAKELKPEEKLSLEQKNSIITNITADDLKKQFENNHGEIASLFLPSVTPFKPTVAFVEPSLTGEVLESNMLWRRARREFFSRFINEQSFKTKIKDDLLKLVDANNPIETLKRGWQNSSFAKDLDLVVEINFIQNEENPLITGRIYAKNGQIITEQKKSFNASNAEQVASQLYTYLLEQLPIESYVVQQEKGVFTLNVGQKQHLNKGDLFIAYVPDSFYSAPNKASGVLKVTEVTDTEAKATAILGLEKLQNNISVRCVRASQTQIDNEMKKSISFGSFGGRHIR